MGRSLKRAWFAMLAGVLLLGACNLPGGPAPAPPTEPPLSQEQIVQTAAAMVLAAQASPTPITGAPQSGETAPTPTTVAAGPCEPIVTANVNANVRGGPGTDYNVTGSLMQSATAKVAGKNAEATWWYIQDASLSGGYGWIAASVTTASCIPASLVVVPAPPLPPTQVAAAPEDDDDGGDSGGLVFQIPPGGLQLLLKPDLYMSEFTITPSTPVMGQNAHVRVAVYNKGTAAAGPFQIVWKGLTTAANPSCSWNVPGLVANGGLVYECNYVFQSWYPINKTSIVTADYAGQVNELNETNNSSTIYPFGVTQ